MDDDGFALAAKLTESTADDAATLPDLLVQVDAPIGRFTADGASGPWRQRNAALRRIDEVGRQERNRESGYRQQARVENVFGRYKHVLGDGLRARDPNAQNREAMIVHVPAQVPGRPEPARVKGTVRLIDVLPTVLELLDARMPEHVQGRSLLDVARGKDPIERSVFSTWPRQRMYALRRGRWKLVERPEWKEKRGEARFELYDLEADPGERIDLLAAPTPEQDRVRAELADELELIRSASARFQARLDGGVEVPLDESERAELKALGYLR